MRKFSVKFKPDCSLVREISFKDISLSTSLVAILFVGAEPFMQL